MVWNLRSEESLPNYVCNTPIVDAAHGSASGVTDIGAYKG